MEQNLYLLGLSSMGGLGLFFAALLVFADKKLRVEVDPKIDLVDKILPAANCGVCGLPGCVAFAEAVVKGTVEVNGCTVGGEEVAYRIASILGVEAKSVQKKVAKVLCRGGNKETEKKAIYYGVTDCSLAAKVGGGEKSCKYGCLGYSDCVDVCKFNAMWMNANGLPVVDEDACTACNKCVEACPRDLIELHSPDIKLHVYCKNLDPGKIAKKICKVACIGCTLCVKPDPENIKMVDNLAVITYSNGYIGLEECAKKCPTDAIAYNLNPIH